MSEDTDQDNIATGIVETIVAGDRITINSSDPANPIVTADVQAGSGETNTASNVGTGDGDVFKQKTGVDLELKTIKAGTNITVTNNVSDITIASTGGGGGENTTKGDIEGFDTAAARIPIGTNDQVLTADSTQALGLKWATPAAGGGSSASIYDVSPGTGFGMLGIQAGSVGALGSSTLTANRIYLDAIYFDGTTTVTELNLWVQTSNAAGIDIHVGLHPMTDRGTVAARAHGDIIVSVTGANQLYSKVLSTAWTPSVGWYFLTIWTGTSVVGVTVNLTDTHHALLGQSLSAYVFTTSSEDTIEVACYILNDPNYDTAPDTLITATDFNDATGGYGFTATVGEVWAQSNIPLIILKAG